MVRTRILRALAIAGLLAALILPAPGIASGAPREPILATGPTILSFDLTPSSIVLGNRTNLSVDVSGGAPPLTFGYSGLPPGCSSENRSAFDCAPTSNGTFAIVVLVRDGAGASASRTSNLTVVPVGIAGPGAEITSFAATPDPLSFGTLAVVRISTTGGATPLTYDYPELPPGCSTDNASSLSCAPSQEGTFGLYALVTDALGHRTGVFGSLSVVPPTPPAPTILTFSAAPARIHLGASTIIAANVTGGAPPLGFNYSNLPDGCVGDSAASVSCTPEVAGNFSIGLRVTDALGRHANSTAHLQVLSAVPPSPVPTGVAGASGFGQFESPVGYATIAFTAVAAAALVATEIGLRQRRLRSEGVELLQALRPRRSTESVSDGESSGGPG